MFAEAKQQKLEKLLEAGFELNLSETKDHRVRLIYHAWKERSQATSFYKFFLHKEAISF